MQTDFQIDSRQEKNRHHLATVICGVIATAALSIAYILLPVPNARFGVQLTAAITALVYLGRTLVIEAGIRRDSGLRMELAFERQSRSWLQRHFGIVFQEDIPHLTDRAA